MAHQITQYMGREAAWHRLGEVVGEWFSLEEMRARINVSFGVEKRQLEFAGQPVQAWGTFRTDSDQFLAPVGKEYTVIHQDLGFKIAEGLMGHFGGAHYETAGVLAGGRKVWAVADLNRSTYVGDDETKTYLMFVAAHDASCGFRFKLVQTRVVCANTLAIALRESTHAKLSVRHTKRGEQRARELAVAAHEVSGEIEGFGERMRVLANLKATRETVEGLMERLFPPVEATDQTTRTAGVAAAQARRENLIGDILREYERNDGDAFPEQRGTLYKLLNAVTNVTDHSQTEGAARAAMFGAGDTRKLATLEYLMNSARTAPMMPARTSVQTAPATQVVTLERPAGLLDQILTNHN